MAKQRRMGARYLEGAEHAQEGLPDDKGEEEIEEGGDSHAGGTCLQHLNLCNRERAKSTNLYHERLAQCD